MKSINKTTHLALCYLPFVLFLLLAIGANIGQAWLLLPIAFSMIIIPTIDTMTGMEATFQFKKTDFSEWQINGFKWAPRLYAICYILAVLLIAKASGQMSVLELVSAVVSLSVIGAIGFGINHEMLHCRTKIDNALHVLISAFLFFPHYKIIHLGSHHVLAATDDDKNTAWLNEGFWFYWLRTIPQSMKRAWDLERNRLSRKNISASAMLVRNRLFISLFVQLGLLLIIYSLFGSAAVIFMLAQVIGAHFIFESVNYIQHYGLLRDKKGDSYEKIRGAHSWDTYHLLTSYLIFRVGHHSFHHMKPTRPYYLLEAQPDALKLPLSYFWAISFVAIPPLWRRLVHPVLERQRTVG